MEKRPELKKSTREYREEWIKNAVGEIAEIDQRIAKFFMGSKGIAEKLKSVDFQTNTWERNSGLMSIINFDSRAQELFEDRKKAVERLKKEIRKYTGKDMMLLKEQLGLVEKPAEEKPTEEKQAEVGQ